MYTNEVEITPFVCFTERITAVWVETRTELCHAKEFS